MKLAISGKGGTGKTTLAALLSRFWAEQGKDVIALTAGEPDFETPDYIRTAAIDALKAKGPVDRYTPASGMPAIRKAVAHKFKRDNGLDYMPDQVMVSCGAKHSCFNMIAALVDEGDEVIIPAPYWVSYPDMVLLADATPVIIESSLEQAFKITPQQLDSAITQKTKAVVINSPSNPTGAVYNREELKALGEVLNKHPHVLVISDDIYEHVMLNGEPYLREQLRELLRQRDDFRF